MDKQNRYYSTTYNVRDIDMTREFIETRIISEKVLTMLLNSAFDSITAMKMYNSRKKGWDTAVSIYLGEDKFYSYEPSAYNRVKTFINSLEIGEEDNDN